MHFIYMLITQEKKANSATIALFTIKTHGANNTSFCV